MTRLLVYTGGEIVGDGLIKLPFLAGLRAAWPEAEIVWATGGETVYAGLLNPVARPLLTELRTGVAAELRLPRALVRRPLAGERFDVVIDTQSAVKRSLALSRIRHGRFLSPAADFRLSHARPPGPWPERMIDRLLALASLAGRPVAAAPVPLPPGDFEAAAAALLPPGPRYVGLAPGAGGRNKCWPKENFVALGRALQAKGATPVLLLGPAEADWLAELRAALPGALFPEWERTDPYPHAKGPCLVMALAGRLAFAVANDSGTGHMLAAGGAPLVSLFTDARRATKFRPTAPRGEVLSGDANGGGVADITLAAVEHAADRLLGGAN